MTPSLENLKNGWLMLIATCILSFFTANYTAKLGATESDRRKLNETIESKASKEELKEAIEGVKHENNIQNEWIIKTLDRIDKRTERLEDRL